MEELKETYPLTHTSEHLRHFKIEPENICWRKRDLKENRNFQV